MTKDGSSSSPPPAARSGKRPLARVACALRGHLYVASRKLDGYETCARCGLRRKHEESPWLAEPAGRPGAGTDGTGESRPRPLAMMLCSVRRHHEFMPSRRMEGFDTCIHCGVRRKAAMGAWFASAPSGRPPQADAEADQASAPQPLDDAVVIPFEDAAAAVAHNGVDPRVLRDFLRQIDSGAVSPQDQSPPKPKAKSDGARRRRTPPQP